MATERSHLTSKRATSSLAGQEITAITDCKEPPLGHFQRGRQLLPSGSLGKEQDGVLKEIRPERKRDKELGEGGGDPAHAARAPRVCPGKRKPPQVSFACFSPGGCASCPPCCPSQLSTAPGRGTKTVPTVGRAFRLGWWPWEHHRASYLFF